MKYSLRKYTPFLRNYLIKTKYFYDCELIYRRFAEKCDSIGYSKSLSRVFFSIETVVEK
jgi:hypothetical protein